MSLANVLVWISVNHSEAVEMFVGVTALANVVARVPFVDAWLRLHPWVSAAAGTMRAWGADVIGAGKLPPADGGDK